MYNWQSKFAQEGVKIGRKCWKVLNNKKKPLLPSNQTYRKPDTRLRKRVPWWNQNLYNLLKKLRAAKRRIKEDSCDHEVSRQSSNGRIGKIKRIRGETSAPRSSTKTHSKPWKKYCGNSVARRKYPNCAKMKGNERTSSRLSLKLWEINSSLKLFFQATRNHIE